MKLLLRYSFLLIFLSGMGYAQTLPEDVPEELADALQPKKDKPPAVLDYTKLPTLQTLANR